VSSMASAIG